MLTKLVRRFTQAQTVEFCDQCAQVCTSTCRAEARLGKVRDQIAELRMPLIR